MSVVTVENIDKVSELERKIAYQRKLHDLTNQINSARNLNEILLEVKDRILELLDADRLTIYAVDSRNNQIYSKIKDGDEIKEIRVAIDHNSIAGYVAATKRVVNIMDVYDEEELSKIIPALKFDRRWDKKTGYRTKQVLAAPIIFQRDAKRVFIGVIQLINKKGAERFTKEDEQSLEEIARVLAIAIHNQHKMVRRKPTKYDYLIEQHLISESALDEAIGKARACKRMSVEYILMNEYNISKEDIGKALSVYYRCGFVSFDRNVEIDPELVRGLKPEYLRQRLWVPFEKKGDKIVVLIDDPFDLNKIDEIRLNPRFRNCEFKVALKEDILLYITSLTHPVSDIEEVGEEEEGVTSISDILQSLESDEEISTEEEEEPDIAEVKETDSSVVKLANQIIRDGYRMNASDIHIEPYGKKDLVVRMRVDGACTNYLKVPASYSKALVSRYKIMAKLDIAEKRKPQDGKIKFKMGRRTIELRVATVPTAGGNEDIVMRILAASEPIPLDKMGMSERNYKEFVNIITKPYGIVLVVGPTGSGKTTTLHSALGYINTPEKKIWTAEDPVEITQYGLRQVQVHPKIGYTFAAAMRAFLRADPDVIMVGEMRDEETASIGIEASLTGHLVFSTLHTNSAPETVTRLLEMGMDPFNFADALLGVLAQRLIRTLCKDCKEAYHPTKQEFEQIVEDYGVNWFEKRLNIKYSDDLLFYRPKGCEKCKNTGYKGRMGIHELLLGTDKIKKIIQRKGTVEELRDAAMEEGMTTLLQDGIWKVFEGYTDYRQVRAVCIK